MNRTMLAAGINAATQTALDGKLLVLPNPPSAYYFFTSSPGSNSTSALSATNLRVVPFLVPKAITLTRLGAEVTTIGDVGSKVRLVIYADDGSCRPGTLVLDAGQINGDSATVQELTISQALTPALYWVGSVSQSVTTTAPTMRTIAGNWTSPVNLASGTAAPGTAATVCGWQLASVTGAAPSSSGSWTPAVNSARLFAKAA